MVPVLVVALLLSACSADSQAFSVTEVMDGLVGPTQIAFDDTGRLLVAEINGGENDMMGTVSAVSLRDLSKTLLFDDLDKPTGVSFFDGQVWVMERDRLSHGPVIGGDLAMVVSDLPNNGRSQGSLTVTDDALLFDTSGAKRGSDVVTDSGVIWQAAGANGVPTKIASGFKHAYAQALDGAGQLWTVEMTDGRFDDERAPDEVVAVRMGADHGWPHCVGDNRPVVEFGGSEERCGEVPRSLVTFDPGASPTSIVVSPWQDAVLLVALWNRGQIVSVRTDVADGQTLTVIVSGLANPQHLLVDGDSVLVSEFGTGRILRLERS